MKILDQIDIIIKNVCFINLKDHKKNFSNILLVRLINPAKNNLGRISNWPGLYLFKVNKVNNKNTRTRFKICSKLTIKTPEQRCCLYYKLWTYCTHCSSVSIVNFEQVFAGLVGYTWEYQQKFVY